MFKFFYLCIFAVVAAESDNYAQLIKDVKEYFTASGVILLRNDIDKNEYEGDIVFAREIFTFNFIRRLNLLGVSSQSIGYSQLLKTLDFHYDRNHQSLYVVYIDSISSLNTFGAITANYDMSRGSYLVILFSCIQPDDNVLNLAFDSRVIVECSEGKISKWYSLDGNRTKTLHFASWSTEMGFYDVNEKFYDQRYKLEGVKLRIGIAKTTMSSEQKSGNNAKYIRRAKYFVEVFEELQKSMYFNVERVVEEYVIGRRSRMITSLLDDKSMDLVVAPMLIIETRLQIVDFSKPLLLSHNRIFIKQPDGSEIHWTAYFRTFTLTAWSMIALTLIIASLMMTFIRATIKQETFFPISIHKVLDDFIRVWGVYCWQGMSEMPSATPLRLVYVSTLILTIIVWQIYSALITSNLTVKLPRLPFSTIDDLVKDGSYQLIVARNSIDYDFITSKDKPSILTKLQPILKVPRDLPPNELIAFKQICKEATVFYSAEIVLTDLWDFVPCRLAYIKTGLTKSWAMVLKKMSPYKSAINYNLQKFEDFGLLDKLKNSNLRRSENPEPKEVSVGFWAIVPVLVIYAAGLVLSLVIFILEHIFKRHVANESLGFTPITFTP